MKILLTGATGFIGSHVFRLLVQNGHTVIALYLPGDSMDRIKNIPREKNKLFGVNLTDVDEIRKIIFNTLPDACIHLAWNVEPGNYLSSHDNISSLINTLNLFRILLDAGCRHITVAGTCSEYDTRKAIALIEESPTRPDTLYAASKISLLITSEQLARGTGASFAWGRIFYLYGPYEDPRRFVSGMILALMNNKTFPSTPGEQIRDFLHVEDVANAFVCLTEKKADGIFNICSGQPVKVRAIIETCANIMDRRDLLRIGELPYRNWEPMYICGNNEKLRNVGWQEKFDLEKGLKHTINWWNRQLEGKVSTI